MSCPTGNYSKGDVNVELKCNPDYPNQYQINTTPPKGIPTKTLFVYNGDDCQGLTNSPNSYLGLNKTTNVLCNNGTLSIWDNNATIPFLMAGLIKN